MKSGSTFPTLGARATNTKLQKLTQPLGAEGIGVRVYEPRCLWSAKNWFYHCPRANGGKCPPFRICLSSFRIRFSRRSRSFSCVRSRSLSDTTSVSRCAMTHLFRVDSPTPKSDATCFRVRQLVSASRTASARNSSVRFSPIVHLLCRSKF